MSEEIKPDVQLASDVALTENGIQESAEPAVNYSEKTLAELSELFGDLMSDPERMARYKDAEAIKAAFYKKLSKEKADAGLVPAEAEAREGAEVQEQETAEAAEAVSDNPFRAIEDGFKSLYNEYRKERAEYTRQAEAAKQENLVKKQAVIEDLKNLVEKQEDVNSTFPAFRELQNRWREIGPVPATKFRDLNDTYQFYVEKFYDMVKIGRDLRDLDFRKNLEAKEAFCEAAEKLAENENIVAAFHELQKLHEQWKEFGPVAKEKREDIWNRFKAATSIINKRYQAYFDEVKSQQEDNLAAKQKLCEQVEELASREDIAAGDWNTISKTIEGIQAEWRKIGYATRKENQKIYDRFRAACDKFYERKREYYSNFKDSMNENLEKKLAIIEQAEALKTSTEWKKATDQFIALQKQWKEIGAVPRKKSEQLWKRFRAACDQFFAERDKNAKPENDFYANLKAKKALIEEILAFEASDDAAAAKAHSEFAERWQAIGHVPFKEKDNVNNAYREAMQKKFPRFKERQGAQGRGGRPAKSPKDQLIEKYNALQQDIINYENNIGFFSASKNSEALIKQMQQRIEDAKAELKELEEKIRKTEEEQN